ncbi:hypothetical protein P7C71_g1612, partial [Lecanoromycetidae sp. Uapishka_2]
MAAATSFAAAASSSTTRPPIPLTTIFTPPATCLDVVTSTDKQRRESFSFKILDYRRNQNHRSGFGHFDHRTGFHI